MLNYAAFYFSKMVITTTQTAQLFILITGKLNKDLLNNECRVIDTIVDTVGDSVVYFI